MASSKSLSLHQLSTYPLGSAGTTSSEQRFVCDKAEYRKDETETENKSWATSIIGLIRAFRQRIEDRRTLLYLKSLDDCYLDDIGINRADIVMARRLENTSMSASAVLQKIALESRKKSTCVDEP